MSRSIAVRLRQRIEGNEGDWLITGDRHFPYIVPAKEMIDHLGGNVINQGGRFFVVRLPQDITMKAGECLTIYYDRFPEGCEVNIVADEDKLLWDLSDGPLHLD